MTQSLAIVVIGRNEGDRLRRCIDTLVQQTSQIVYVDSGSSDDSVAMAKSRGVHVVNLDMSRPFTAARARNEGFGALRRVYPNASCVQFVDGDCDVHPDWLATATTFLASRPDVAAVYGTLSERHPEKSIYNMQAHMTWNPTEAGETDFFGGNFMIRTGAMASVNGFNESVIDSEDHELAIRVREKAGKVWYLQHPMAIHDLAVYAFAPWWRRTLRGGYGNGMVVSLHRHAPGKPHQRAWYRSWVWGLALPLFIVVATWLVGPIGLAPVLLYGISFVRSYQARPEHGGGNAKLAVLSIVGKFAEMLGQLKFVTDRLMKRRATIIEYK